MPPARRPAFEILGPIREVRTIAVGGRIRDIAILLQRYGSGRWLKRSGFAAVRLLDGTIRVAELHWYEAQGIGRKAIKIKRYQDE